MNWKNDKEKGMAVYKQNFTTACPTVPTVEKLMQISTLKVHTAIAGMKKKINKNKTNVGCN